MRKNAQDQAKELESHVESLVHSKPDFGYPDQLEFGDRTNNQVGWGFFMDMIGKYRQREKITNTISHFLEIKKQAKEEKMQKMTMKMAGNTNTQSVKRALHATNPTTH